MGELRDHARASPVRGHAGRAVAFDHRADRARPGNRCLTDAGDLVGRRRRHQRREPRSESGGAAGAAQCTTAGGACERRLRRARARTPRHRDVAVRHPGRASVEGRGGNRRGAQVGGQARSGVGHPDARRVRARSDRTGQGGQRRSRGGPQRRDRGDHRDPLPASEEQPGADRRPRRRKDGNRRRTRATHRQRRRPVDARRATSDRARHEFDGRGRKISRRVRGAPHQGARRGARALRRARPVHRRAAHHRRCRIRRRGFDGRGQHAQARARPR